MSHCWTDRSEWIDATYGYLSDEAIEYTAAQYCPDACGEVCMLPTGHFGPHRWTRTDEIVVTFNETTPEVAVPPAPRCNHAHAVETARGAAAV